MFFYVLLGNFYIMSCLYPSQGYFKPMICQDGRPGRQFVPSKAIYEVYASGGNPIAFAQSLGQEYGQRPCRLCVPCKLKISREWAIRCIHECSLHEESCFLTLTYAPEHLPEYGSLRHEDFQLFMKRLRENTGLTGLKYYMCGEYGSKTSRPHYHVCLFGYNFKDLVFYKNSKGFALFKSQFLTDTWKLGHCSVGACTFETCAYVARYVLKKVVGLQAISHYGVRTPEYGESSRRPGLGKAWYEAFKTDMLSERKVAVLKKGEAKVLPAPPYYDKFFKDEFPIRFAEIAQERKVYLTKQSDRLTAKRMEVYRECFSRKYEPFERDFTDEDI